MMKDKEYAEKRERYVAITNQYTFTGLYLICLLIPWCILISSILYLRVNLHITSIYLSLIYFLILSIVSRWATERLYKYLYPKWLDKKIAKLKAKGMWPTTQQETEA
ncbi:MAG: hypothetical protein V4490_01275 [Pseudomonadota bacterium]